MDERRKTKRFVEKNKAVINFTIEKQAVKRKPHQAWTKDISIDGAKLIAPKSFPFDARLIISLELPKSKQLVKLWARVVWAKESKEKGKHEIGVEFIHSLETMPNLFQHFYGHESGQPKKRIKGKGRKYPVDVFEV